MPVIQQIAPVRIIPAYAGSTLMPSMTSISDWDHPRICGEHE